MQLVTMCPYKHHVLTRHKNLIKSRDIASNSNSNNFVVFFKICEKNYTIFYSVQNSINFNLMILLQNFFLLM